MKPFTDNKLFYPIVFTILAVVAIVVICVLSLVGLPEWPTSPLPTPVSPITTPEITTQAVSEVITGTIAIFWNDVVGPEPSEVTSSNTITSELYIDLKLKLDNGNVLTQTIDTGLSAPGTPGEGQFGDTFDYVWIDVPMGVHNEYSRLRWELYSSDVLIVQSGEYKPYHETIYGVLIVNGKLMPIDNRHFSLYRTIGQYHYYYLPLILRNAS